MNKPVAFKAASGTNSTRADKGSRIAQPAQNEDVAAQHVEPAYLGLSMNKIYDQLEVEDFLKTTAG